MKIWEVHNTLESGFFRISPQLGHQRGFMSKKDARLAAKAPEMRRMIKKMKEQFRLDCHDGHCGLKPQGLCAKEHCYNQKLIKEANKILRETK